MVDNVLVPLDGSERGYDALEYAIREHPDASVTLLHALEYGDAATAEGAVVVMDEGIKEASKNRAENIFEEAQKRGDDLGYEGTLETRTDEGRPRQVIVEHSEEFDAVIMGSYGREGIGQKLLGSVAETVVRRSPVPVTVVR